jgi:hypothetical protein
VDTLDALRIVVYVERISAPLRALVANYALYLGVFHRFSSLLEVAGIRSVKYRLHIAASEWDACPIN